MLTARLTIYNKNNFMRKIRLTESELIDLVERLVTKVNESINKSIEELENEASDVLKQIKDTNLVKTGQKSSSTSSSDLSNYNKYLSLKKDILAKREEASKESSNTQKTSGIPVMENTDEYEYTEDEKKWIRLAELCKEDLYSEPSEYGISISPILSIGGAYNFKITKQSLSSVVNYLSNHDVIYYDDTKIIASESNNPDVAKYLISLIKELG